MGSRFSLLGIFVSSFIRINYNPYCEIINQNCEIINQNQTWYEDDY